MTAITVGGNASRQSRSTRLLAAALLTSTALISAPLVSAQALDATWSQTPFTDQLDNDFNWIGGSVPTGTATFGQSQLTSLLTHPTYGSFGGWHFTSNLSYMFQIGGGVSFTGTGITSVGTAPIVTNDGTLSFSNSSSAGNATLINNGSLSFYNSSSAGSANIANTNTATFYNSSTAGTASITLNGLGALSFRNTSIAGSATIDVSATSSLHFWDTSTAGSATITTATSAISDAWVTFNNASTAGSASITNAGVIYFNDQASAAAAVIGNTGRLLAFRNSSTAGTATITNSVVGVGGGIEFLDNSSAGNATITNQSGGTLAFLDNSTAGTATITNQAGGFAGFGGYGTAGSATIVNNGTFLVLNFGSAASATITNNAGMEFGEGSTAGNAAITNNGVLLFSRIATAGSATITNSVGGAGGTIEFIDHSSAGSATISNEVTSTINFYNISSAGNATIANNGALFFRNDSTAGTATISGSGVSYFLNNSSTGNATITTNGAVFLSTSDQTGAATVTIQSGGALIGFGSVGNTTIQSGGTFGAAGGTLRINGNLIVGPGSLYGAGAIYGVAIYGLTDVTGTAAIGGARLYVAPPTGGFSFQTGESFTALTAAGGVTGTFSLEGLSPLISVLYGTNDVTITIAAYRVGAALGGAGGSNARSVGAALDRVIDASGGAPPSPLDRLLWYHGASLGNAMNGLSGEAAAGAHASAFTSASTFLGIMLDPMAGARGATAAAPGSSLIQMADTGRTPAARVAAGWSVWTKSFGQAGRTASDAATGAAGTASSLYGVAAGADRLISADTLIGFALAGGGTAYGLGTRGTGSGDFAQVGLYGSTRLGPGYVSAALAYGWNRFDVSRTAGLGVAETYRSAPTVHTFGGRIEAGRRFGDRAFATTPYAAVEAIGASTGGYRETWGPGNTGAFALTYGARTYATARAEAGVRLDSLRAVAPTADLLTFARLAYGFQAGTQRSAEASFQQIATTGFTVFGARASTHTALGSLGLELRLASGTRVTASLDGELGDRHRSLRANAGISHSW